MGTFQSMLPPMNSVGVVTLATLRNGETLLGFVVFLILVVAVEAQKFRRAGAGDGGFEARGLRNDEVGGDAAVGPAAYAEFVGVGDALLDGVIDHGHVVLEIFVAPVDEDGFAVVLAITRRAAWIGEEDGVPVGGVERGQVGEFSIVRPDGAAVGNQEGGVAFARDVVDGLVEVAEDGSSVFGFEVDVFAMGEAKL